MKIRKNWNFWRPYLRSKCDHIFPSYRTPNPNFLIKEIENFRLGINDLKNSPRLWLCHKVKILNPHALCIFGILKIIFEPLSWCLWMTWEFGKINSEPLNCKQMSLEPNTGLWMLLGPVGLHGVESRRSNLILLFLLFVGFRSNLKVTFYILIWILTATE